MTGLHRAAAPAAAAWLPTGARSALIRHVARMTPWGPLLAGCLTGIGVAAALRALAGPAETPAVLGAGVRAGFIPVMAGLAFLLADPARQLAGALAARAWLTPAVRLVLALPVLILTAVLQLWLAGRALAADLRVADLRVAGQPPASLPWVALAAELAAWCALALALAAGFQRTRWQDLAGLTAAITGPALIGTLALLPARLLPATIAAMTSAQHRQWTTAWQLWTAAAAALALAASWAAGDPWHRLPRPARPRSPGRGPTP